MHALRKLPKRDDRYMGLKCSATCCGPFRGDSPLRCTWPVSHIASFSQGAGMADRLYCDFHAKRFARRWGLRCRK